MRPADVIVVGAGGSGAVVAARLSENPERRVLLLEAGEAWSSDDTEAGRLLRDARSLLASVDPRTSWLYPAELIPGRRWDLARGRGLGGSSAVNAGYFLRATASDLALWEERIGWSQREALDAYDRASRVVGVRVPAQDDPLTVALARAGRTLGLADLAPLPLNIVEGRRHDTGRAYLAPLRERANLEIVTGAQVRRALIHRTATGGFRAGGVEARLGGRRRAYEAAEVVLCAGAIGTAQLLLRSGVGPASDLEPLGIRVAADLPVGRETSDHPQVALPWIPRVRIEQGTEALRSVLHTGDLELLPLLRSTDELLGRPAPARQALDLLVADQAPLSRGTLTLDPADPSGAPLIRSGYLAGERDRDVLRAGVRLAVDLLGATDVAAEIAGPDERTLGSDAALDAWVRAHLGTALHLSGTAKAGRAGDPDAVTDPAGNVLGVGGLRIVDLSLLPGAPSRGPAATAVMLGELLAGHDRP